MSKGILVIYFGNKQIHLSIKQNSMGSALVTLGCQCHARPAQGPSHPSKDFRPQDFGL